MADKRDERYTYFYNPKALPVNASNGELLTEYVNIQAVPAITLLDWLKLFGSMAMVVTLIIAICCNLESPAEPSYLNFSR